MGIAWDLCNVRLSEVLISKADCVAVIRDRKSLLSGKAIMPSSVAKIGR
jgi:hypothetical protein